MRDDDVLRTKFIYSEEPTISIKLAGLKTAPLFRQATTVGTTTEPSNDVFTTSTTSTTTSTAATTNAAPNDGPETSQGDLENSTVISSREADEVVESTTDIEEDVASTTVEIERTKPSSPFTTQGTTEKTESVKSSIKIPSTSSKPSPTGGVLFQDMEEAASEKVKVNFKLAGV